MQTPNIQSADQPGPNPIRRVLQQANATLDGPKAPDVSPYAGSSSLAIDRAAALAQAKEHGVLFLNGGQLDDLGSEAVKAALAGGGDEIKAARLTPKAPTVSEAPETPTEPPVAMPTH